jgi:hypothetical protein
MHDYDPQMAQSRRDIIPEGGVDATTMVTTVETIRLKQKCTSGQKARAYIIIVFCILCFVAGMIILVVLVKGRTSTNTYAQIESADLELTFTAEDKIPMSAQMNSDLADLKVEGVPTQTSSLFPSYNPTEKPSSFPSTLPSSGPSNSPSTELPTSAPFLPIVLGQEMYWTNEKLGIRLSVGLSAKIVAVSGRGVIYGDGNKSSRRFHGMMDGAGIVSLQNGGYVYVSNSEEEGSDGGTYLEL